MYPSQETFPWNLEQENTFIEVSRNHSADVWRTLANGDVATQCSKTLRMLNKKLIRFFPLSLSLEMKGSASRVLVYLEFSITGPGLASLTYFTLHDT